MNQVTTQRGQTRALILGGMSALLSLALMAPAQAAPSTFQNSCRNIELQTDSNEVSIHAECRTRSGDYNATAIELVGVSNEYGTLRGRGDAPSSFQNSCRNVQLRYNPQEVDIAAICEDGKGGEKNTSITLHDIENNDGNLN
ncbi:mannose-binding lectin [Pseudomonas huaxiensis]|uniref:mannose-binding lectin n=1 Tax=Pseudomonas huaxiensis TaxID=2213017 RepID=UPI000DA6ADF3|nr:CVNH domain-containing protein [Pseudomonas huaxiensis]